MWIFIVILNLYYFSFGFVDISDMMLTKFCLFYRHLLYSWQEGKCTLRSADQIAAVHEEEVCALIHIQSFVFMHARISFNIFSKFFHQLLHLVIFILQNIYNIYKSSLYNHCCVANFLSFNLHVAALKFCISKIILCGSPSIIGCQPGFKINS